MTYVVTEHRIRCKYMECVEVCPIDCFHEGENMLVIDPDVCIDCGVCEAECPVEAILPEGLEEADHWLALNAEYSQKWPLITVRRQPHEDAESFETIDGKFDKYFSEKPGGAE